MPGIIMALCRLDIPGMMLYGGSIAPGKLNGVDITIQDVFEGIGSYAAGRIDDAGLEALEANACPGGGACGGQFTANTMAMSGEILGISPIELSGVPATDPNKLEATRAAGRMLMDAVRANRRPSQIITRKSLENTIASVAASGGSTNAVLHLLAIAREMGIALNIDDFDIISKRTPYICSLTPAGKYVASDYQAAGGSRLLAKRMIDAGYADGSALTISGKTLAEEAALAKETPGQDVIATFEKPIKPNGGLVILKGNLAPEGCVMKIAAAGRYGASRAGARLRLRRRLLQGGAGGRHQARRCGGDSLRRPEGRAGHARDAAGDCGDLVQCGAERARGAAHRRPLQWRDARIHRGPRGSRGVCRRADCGGARGRHDPLRHSQAHAECRNQRRGDGGAVEGLQTSGAALAPGRLPQICRPRDVGVRRGNDVKSRD